MKDIKVTLQLWLFRQYLFSYRHTTRLFPFSWLKELTTKMTTVVSNMKVLFLVRHVYTKAHCQTTYNIEFLFTIT